MTMIVDGFCEIGSTAGPHDDLATLLRGMDRLAVDRAVVFPPPRCLAWENEAGNDLTTAAVEEFPDRLFAAVSVNPWRPDAETVLTRYLTPQVVLAFSPERQGFNPAEGLLDPLLEKVLRGGLRPPVYLHTGPHSLGAPSQLAMLAQRFPALTFIMGHSGATDYGTDAVPTCRLCPNVYLESSFARPPGFVAKLGQIGFDRGVYGSGFPYNQIETELSEMKRLLPPEHHAAVLGKTLLKLIGGQT